MNYHTLLRVCFLPAACTTALAQGPDFLVTYSHLERTTSGTGGTVLADLHANEICHLAIDPSQCAVMSAEKWLPRTAAHVMAGDEDANGLYWNPVIFGNVDALLAAQAATPIAGTNQRTTFWSVSQPMGTFVSGNPFRPGDVARIVRNGAGEGQVEYFMRQEQFNQSLGLPPNFPIDVDAIAFAPGFGVFFSIDDDTSAITRCGPTLVRDGDVLHIDAASLTYTGDLRIASVLSDSAVVYHSEAQMDAFTAAAGIADRFGACVTTVGDVESLEFDYGGAVTQVFPCPGIVAMAPPLIYSTETCTGAGVLTTAGTGAIYVHGCGLAGTPCGAGQTLGPQFGIAPVNFNTGAQSHVDGLTLAQACHHVLEPQQHVLTVPTTGLPAGATSIDWCSEFVWNFGFVEIVPPVVPQSFPAFPWSLNCFPDLYTPSLFAYPGWLIGNTGSFPLPAIPGGFAGGKLLFQSIGIGTGLQLELSTPCVLDL